MKAKKQITAFREWLVVPGLDTGPDASDPDGWAAISDSICPHCKAAIGRCVGVFLYHPSRSVAHIRCVEETEERAIAERSSGFMVDAAAKLGKLTQTQFRELPSWEKDRLIEQVKFERAKAAQQRDITK